MPFNTLMADSGKQGGIPYITPYKGSPTIRTLVVQAVSDVLNWTSQAATDAWNWTKQAGTDAWDWIKQAGTDAWDWTKQAGTDIWMWIKQNDKIVSIAGVIFSAAASIGGAYGMAAVVVVSVVVVGAALAIVGILAD